MATVTVINIDIHRIGLGNKNYVVKNFYYGSFNEELIMAGRTKATAEIELGLAVADVPASDPRRS